ncbi:type II secretion system F family protein [Candidatus Nomurabacteria bacterium]|nr:type II secretion system F family protein [Candidatus Nomurabacteria bacterium]
MIFSYSAKARSGEFLKGTIDAPDRFTAARDIKARGEIPLSISIKDESIFGSLAFLQNFLGRVKMKDLIIITKNLSGMIKAGLSLARALSVLEKQAGNNVALHNILVSISAEINSGGTLSSGFSKFPNVFSKLFISMTRAGEESGNLANALSEIGTNLEKEHSLTRKVKGALIYPGVIFSAMIVVGVLMFAFVVPTLASTFKSLGVTLPLSTRAIIWLGNFFSNNLFFTFIVLILGAFGMFSFFNAKFMAKYIDFIITKLPLIGTLVKEINTARTTRSLSSLLLSGVSITRSIEITEDVVQNVYYKKILREAKDSVEKGAPLSETFSNNLKFYPVMMSEMVQVGEETGKLSDMLLQVAIFYEEEIENKTKNLSTIIEPVLMIVIGSGVGFFAISMISPLYSVLDNIK